MQKGLSREYYLTRAKLSSVRSVVVELCGRSGRGILPVLKIPIIGNIYRKKTPLRDCTLVRLDVVAQLHNVAGKVRAELGTPPVQTTRS